MSEEWEQTEEPQAEESGGRGWFWLALFVMAAICAVAAYRSALFRFERLEVTGLERLTEARITELTGLVKGGARWQHPASSIRERLLADPWIKSADVTWRWSTVSIQLAEREPIGLIRYSDRYYLMLDVTGVILSQAELQVGQALPVIAGKEVQTALRGRTLADPGVLDALAVLAPMAPPLRNQISEVRVGEDRSLTFYMAPGAMVLWGRVPVDGNRADVTMEKMKVFGGLWNGIGNRTKACQIDLRVEGNYSAGGCN